MSTVEEKIDIKISHTMTRLRLMHADGTSLIVEDQIYGIEESLRNYRQEIIQAFNQPLKFNGEYTIEDNFKSFLNVNLYDLGILTTTFMPECSSGGWNMRSMHRGTKSYVRIYNVISMIYETVLDLEQLALCGVDSNA